jgi:rSAM/selenodomain-associated transferase 1
MAIDCRLLVFAKAPLPGAVKTRLIPLLGPERAAALHRALLDHVLATAAASGAGPLELWCAPDCRNEFLRSCATGFGASLHAQPDGDLGTRMSHAFERALRDSPAAILIGSDCAVLGPQHIRVAATALAAGAPAVFCPVEDGGYALIGLSRHDPALFEGIRWGESSVMACTRRRLRELGWRWRELETLWDIDRPEDYYRLRSAQLLDAPLL